MATLVALLAVGLTGTAQAAWEAPQRIDTEGEDRGSSGVGEIATGTNGLTTVFFFQSTDSGQLRIFRHRAGDAAGWAAPINAGFTRGAGDDADPSTGGAQPELDASDAGTVGLALRVERQRPAPDPPSPTDPTAEDDNLFAIYGGGWPAGVEAPSSLKQLLGNDEIPAAADPPDVDVDGSGIGHVVAALDPPAAPGPPPSDVGAEIHYNQFNPASGDRIANTAQSNFVQHFPPATPPTEEPDDSVPSSPASAPRLDANEDGDVAISFVAKLPPQGQADPRQRDTRALYAARRLKGGSWSSAQRISQSAELEAVAQHDIAIAPDGTITVVFAADPAGSTNKIYARRWLATASEPRPEGQIELVSSSAAGAPNASIPRIVADDAGRSTVAWIAGGSQLFAAERTTNWNIPQALSTNAGQFDLAVDAEGAGTIVYREGTNLRGRTRTTGTKWGDPDTINTAPLETGIAPRVDARKPLQADVYFVQTNGSLKSAYASRFIGSPPPTVVAPPKPDTEDCPGDISVIGGDSAKNTLTGTDERESIMAGDGDDTVFGRGGDDCIRGQGGNDQANGEVGNDNVGGGDGDDTVTGGDGDDIVNGAAGNDTVNGNAGNDTGTGGDGNDTVDGEDGNDTLSGDTGDDKVDGGVGDDIVGGGDGNDAVYGSPGNNTLDGGLGDDRLFGGPELDTLIGGDGNDRLSGGAGAGNLQGGAGNDILGGGVDDDDLDGGAGNDKLSGRLGDDELKGDLGSDTIRGGVGKDRLIGDDGRDRLYGDVGNDRLEGDFGNDRIRGGFGNDRLFGHEGDDRIRGDRGKDRISAGDGEDRIHAVDKRRDRITCGGGLDRVKADWIDRVKKKSCEKITRVGKKPKKKTRRRARNG